MVYDLLIIGAGPAGMSAAFYGVSRGKSVLVLEKGQIGGLIRKVSAVTHYAGAVPGESGGTFSQRLEAQAESMGVEVRYETVTSTVLAGAVKRIMTEQGTYEAKNVILAAGMRPNRLGIVGEDGPAGKRLYLNAALDGENYKGKQVYVIGGADGAIKEALYLAGIAEKVTILHFEDQLGAIAQFTTALEKMPNIEVRLHTRLVAVHGVDDLESIELSDVHTKERKIVPANGAGVFIYAGAVPNTALFGGVEKKNGFLLTDEQMETNIPGVYAIGDLRVKTVRQVATAVAEGAIAAIHAAK